MSNVTDDELRRALTKIDIMLGERQARWETPRNLAIVGGVVVALASALSGWIAFQAASRPPEQIIVHLDQPLHLQMQPSP
jgi:hypothetical protein